MRIVSILIQGILFFFLFLILVCLFNIPLFTSFLYNKIEITLYLKDKLSFSSKEALMKRISKKRSGMEIKYQSKEEILKGLVPSNIINILDKNPLSDVYKIRLFGKIEQGDFENLALSLKEIKEIKKIDYSKSLVELLGKIKNVLLKGFLMIGLLYLFGIIIILSCLSLRETRLSKEDREILYLSGRTKWSISLSLLISSMIDGLLGSILATGLLFIGWTFFTTPLFGFEIAFLEPGIILSLLGIGILLGFLTKIPSLLFI